MIRPHILKYVAPALAIALSISGIARAEEVLVWRDCVYEAKQNHPDLRSAFEKVNQARASKEITRGRVMPTITGNASEVTSKGAVFGSAGAGTASDIQGGSRTSSKTI